MQLFYLPILHVMGAESMCRRMQVLSKANFTSFCETRLNYFFFLQMKVKLLIEDGADVNRKLPPTCPLVGKSLLYAAALLDNYETVKILLENGAEIRLTSKKTS